MFNTLFNYFNCWHLHFFRLMLLLFGVFYFNHSFAVYAPSLVWKTIETPHFIIHFHTELEASVDEIADKAEKIHTEVSTYFNWSPVAKTHIILSDQSELPNGSASVFPRNRIEILMSPPADVSGLENYDDWMFLVLKHEYVHIVHLDKAADLPFHARSLLGRHWLFFPNTFLPRWLIEGLATYLEADKGSQFGRGKSSYYRALMRNEVIHGIKSLRQINQFRTQWPSGSSSYLYGVYFFTFLSKTYGEQKIKAFVDEYSQFPLPYFVNTVTNMVFDKDMFALWDEFTVYLNNDFSSEITRIQKTTLEHHFEQPIKITNTSYLTGYTHLSKGKLYFIQSDRENSKQLVAFNPNTKSFRTIFKIPNQDGIFPHTFDVHPNKGILIPILENYENSRQSFDLFSVDPKSGNKSRLTKNKRYLKAIWNQSGTQILALGNKNGEHHLDILDENGTKLYSLWQGERGFAINAFDWSEDEEKIVISMFSPNTGWNLHLINIQNKQWQQITFDKSIEVYPRFIKNDSHIIYSADYNANYNVFELSLESISSNTAPLVQQLTNSLTAALFPEWDKNNSQVFYSELDKNGFNVKSSTIDRSLSFDLSDTSSKPIEDVEKKSPPRHYAIKNYLGFKYLTPTWWIPLYLSDNDQKLFGFITNGSDPLGKQNFYAKILYGNTYDTLEWEASYLNRQQLLYLQLNLRRDYFNSLNYQRKETESVIAVIYPYVKRAIRWQFLSSFRKSETEISQFNIFRLRHDAHFYTFGINVNSTQNSLLAVSPHSGLISSIIYEENKFFQSIQNNGRVTFDTSLYSPVFYHAVFKAQATIVTAGNRASNTYLGGTIGSDSQTTILGKSTYPLKGFKVDQFVGTNMQKLAFHTFYPLLFPETGIMSPPVGIRRINLKTLFETARVGSYREINSLSWYSSIALELSIKSNFGYGRLPFNFTIGLAKGIGKLGERQTYSRLNFKF